MISRCGHSSSASPAIRIASARSASTSRPSGSSSLRSVCGGSLGAHTRQEPNAITVRSPATGVRITLGGNGLSGSGQTFSPSSSTS
jgi:hypothetical protein